MFINIVGTIVGVIAISLIIISLIKELEDSFTLSFFLLLFSIPFILCTHIEPKIIKSYSLENINENYKIEKKIIYIKLKSLMKIMKKKYLI